jgi:hypothetical protein
VKETVVDVRGGDVEGVPDKWQWRPNPTSNYSVCGAYQILISEDAVTLGEADDLLWQRLVSMKKVYIL